MTLEILTLVDDTAGSSAQILPGLGCNCFRFTACPAGAPLDVLWSAPDYAQGTARPVGSGLPILFPFAGRIRGARFHYDGRDFDLSTASDDGRGNAIHGFVCNRPWRIVEHAAASASAVFQASRDAPELLALWPADFRIAVRYTLAGNSLSVQFTLDNPDERPLPFGLGTHGYFRLPLGAGGAAADCIVRVPARAESHLVDLLPTGLIVPTPVVRQLSAGLTLKNSQLDCVLTDLVSERARCQASVADPASGRRLTVEFDRDFAACVAFTPPHGQAICLEPYTTIPDPFWLLQRGHDPHLIVLAPGQRWRASMTIRIE